MTTQPTAPRCVEKREGMSYKQRTTQITIAPKGQPIYSERAWTIGIDSEGGGEFVKITSLTMHMGAKKAEVQIDSEEWPALRDGIEYMLEQCKDDAA